MCLTCGSTQDVSNFRLTDDSLYGHPAYVALGSGVAVERERQHQSITS